MFLPGGVIYPPPFSVTNYMASPKSSSISNPNPGAIELNGNGYAGATKGGGEVRYGSFDSKTVWMYNGETDKLKNGRRRDGRRSAFDSGGQERGTYTAEEAKGKI
jgi:hypothetical protein